MRQREYEALCVAIGRFMANEDGAWEDGMEILSKLKEAFEQETTNTADMVD